MTKLGGGTLTLTGASTYTGGTVLAAGVLQAGTAGALGSSGTLAFNGGTLRYSTTNQTDYSGRFATADNQAVRVDTNGQNVTFATGLTSPGGSLTKSGFGTLTLTGASTYTGDTTVLAGTLVLAGSINGGNGPTLTVNGDGASVSTLNQIGGSSVTVGNLLLGRFNENSNGTYTLSGGSLSTRFAYVGFLGRGTFNQSGGTFSTNGNNLYVGQNPGSTGTYNLSGTGNLSTGPIVVGHTSDSSGTFNQSGGIVSTNGNNLYVALDAGSSGTYNLSGGSLTTGLTQVSDNNNVGTFTQTGGTHTTATLALTGNDAASRGTYTLSGGTLNVGTVSSGDGGVSGTSTFNFDGGTLRPSASTTGFMSGLTTANVQAGGARIDTAGFNVTVAQALVHDTTAGAPATDGGLLKNGAGTLTLTGTNTYTGATTVGAGTLSVASDANLGAAGGVVNLSNGATLAITGSAFTTGRTFNLVNNTLTPAGGGAITYAGATVNGGTLGAGSQVLADATTLNGTRTVAGTVLSQSGGGTVAFNNVTLSGASTFSQAAGATLNATGDFIATPPTTVTVNGTVNAQGGSTRPLSTMMSPLSMRLTVPTKILSPRRHEVVEQHFALGIADFLQNDLLGCHSADAANRHGLHRFFDVVAFFDVRRCRSLAHRTPESSWHPGNLQASGIRHHHASGGRFRNCHCRGPRPRGCPPRLGEQLFGGLRQTRPQRHANTTSRSTLFLT